MRDFVRDVWRVAAGSATGAFFLSLVIGLIAGNPFGAAFIRALLLAVVFAGLGAGLRYVVKTYLPELMESTAAAGTRAPAAASGRTSAESAGRGATVDIVLPEDDDLRRQTYGGAGKSRGGSSADTDGTDDELAAELDGEEASEAEPVDEDTASQAEAQALGELAEELADELPPAGDSAVSNRGGGGDRGDETGEELEPEDGSAESSRESSGGLDSLPDIAALEPADEQHGRRAPRMPLPRVGERPQDAVRSALSGQDPQTLAKAIRTALKKDEKG